MDLHEYASLEQRLRSRGWTQDAAGAWSAPGKGSSGVLCPVEARRAERASARALDKGGAVNQGGAGGVAIRVTCIALRRRLIDAHDGTAYSMKALTDSIAKTLGLDDADPRMGWEYFQEKTAGEQGVLVKVEMTHGDVKRG